jgi:hypothetical protein
MQSQKSRLGRRKKRMGRPPTGRPILASSRFPKATNAAVNAYAKRHGITRSLAIRLLVEVALKDQIK